MFLDHVYTVPTKKYISKIIEVSSIDKQEYINDKKDCDDFARTFYAETSFIYGVTAVALVIDFSSNHAYNIFWMKEGNLLKLQVIEPQTDEIQVIGEAGYEAKSRYCFNIKEGGILKWKLITHLLFCLYFLR